MTFSPVALAAVATVLTAVAPAASAPTPIPGGADQVSAVAGTVGKPVWNGVLKITLSPLRDATDEETKTILPSDSQKAMYFAARLQNGSHDTFADLLTYQFADANGITSDVAPYLIKHGNPHILQGGAQMQSAVFPVDKDFVPTKLIVQCATCGTHSGFRPIRFALVP